MTVTSKLAKFAIFREEGYPIGKPAPTYFRCTCGRKIDRDGSPEYSCECGKRISESGWLLDDSGAVTVPYVLLGLAGYMVYWMVAHGVFQALTVLQR